MIQSIYKIGIALSLCFVCLSAQAKLHVKKEKFTEVIEKSFNINNDANVVLFNKYGKMDIKTWDKSVVSIQVTITVKAKSRDAADAEFDRINIDFENSPSRVSATTSLEEKKSSWWGGGSWNSSSDFTIDYLVNLPSTVHLDASNKYGNMYVETMDEALKITQKYGDFEVAGVNDNFEFSLGYGNGHIGFANDVKGYVKYSNLNIDKSENMNLESKYSKMRFEKVKALKSISKYDKFTIGDVESLENEGKYDNFIIEKVKNIDVYTKYTDCRISYLYDTGEFDFSYGGIRIENLDSSFNEIDIDGSYTSCKIERDGDCDMDFDVKTSYADIDIPDDAQLHYKEKDGSRRHYKGHFGSPNVGRKLKVALSYGSFELR